MQISSILGNNNKSSKGGFSRDISISTPSPTAIEFQPSNNLGLKSRKSLQKRAKAKFYTNSIVVPLIRYALRVGSPLLKVYRNAFYCNCVLRQNGQKLTGSYCNTRACHTCNRIRTAKLINQYLPEMKTWNNIAFLTLTIVNCKDFELKDTLALMNKNLALIQRKLKEKRGIIAKGIIKIEITYNWKLKSYHPHFHILSDNYEYCQLLMDEWFIRYPTAVREAQELKYVNTDSIKELFKYCTKIVETEKSYDKKIAHINLKALDVILRSIHTKRTIKVFGFKASDEEINNEFKELQGVSYYDLPADRGEAVSSSFYDYSTHQEKTTVLPSYIDSIEYRWVVNDWFYDTRNIPYINPNWKSLFYNDNNQLVTTEKYEPDNGLNPYKNPEWEPLFALSEYVPPDKDSKYYIEFKFHT